jgi:demethylmenaquinone methyltransferase/2-methoxy-6-polyprenyl-1,4-benzoquinol methylase
MPFRSRFDCLWCGRPWNASSEADLTGWAGLCADCLERAADNQFLRYRLRTALRERSGGGGQLPAPASPTTTSSSIVTATLASPAVLDLDREMREYYAARTPEYDDWYLRRGRYSRGPARDIAWQLELDQATGWLDRQPLTGEIVELAAGTGWWSPLLAQKGELSLYDINPGPLERARERLVAHGLRAHLHVRDAWEAPDRQVDALFCGFWLSHVSDDRLVDFLAIVRRWLRPGGVFAFIDSLPDPESGAIDHPPVGQDGVAIRRLADGREFRVVKMYRDATALRDALERAGFEDVQLDATARFFQMGIAVRAG